MYKSRSQKEFEMLLLGIVLWVVLIIILILAVVGFVTAIRWFL